MYHTLCPPPEEVGLESELGARFSAELGLEPDLGPGARAGLEPDLGLGARAGL